MNKSQNQTISRLLESYVMSALPTEDIPFAPRVKKAEEPKPIEPLPELIAERHTTHGDFAENARVSQSLKEVFRLSPGWQHLADIEREAMDMIALKFSRILSGKSLQKQHWEDVVGYGQLVERECK